MEENPILKAAILEVVDNQLRENDPPETRQTLDRLIAEGHSKGEAKKMIGAVVSLEMFDVLKKKEPYNHERFAKALNRLPKLVHD